MALIPQDDNGTVANANGYGSVAGFKAYHDDRGNNYGDIAEDGDNSIEQCIIKATDYVDGRFSYVGSKRYGVQTTQWPRTDAWDKDGYPVNGIPEPVLRATYEYAFRALSGDIDPDPVRDDSGRTVISKSEGLGPLQQSVTYGAGGSVEAPRYPKADRILSASGLVDGSTTGGLVTGDLVRG